jgi:hypothetical protein
VHLVELESKKKKKKCPRAKGLGHLTKTWDEA